MATDKQIGYYQRLLSDLGEPVSGYVIEEFAQLPVRDASAKITELEQQVAAKDAGAAGSSDDAAEPA